MLNVRQCQYCSKVFSRSFNLRRHLEKNSCKMKDNDSIAEDNSDSESIDDMSSENSELDCETSDASSSESDAESDDSPIPWYWQILVDEAIERHEEEKEIMVKHLVSNGEINANRTVYEKMLPVLRKELRKILTEKLEWLHSIKKDYYFKKILKTRRELLDSGDYDLNEATKLAIHQRKFLLDDLIPSQDDEEESDKSDSMESLS